jgi:hypothetical protein
MYYQKAFARIFLMALVLAALAAAPAAALKVEGARIALDVEAGKTYNSTIGVSIGTGEAGGEFAIDVLGFGQALADGTYTGLEAAADTAPTTARPFITLDHPTVHLKPGERAVVTAMIRVPADFREGGRYAIILVHPAAAPGQQASFATAVAIPVLLTAKGGAGTEAGEITSLEPGAVSEGKPVTVETVLKNTGDLHYYGVVNKVSLKDASGKLIGNASTVPLTRAIVPGQSVKFTVDIPAPRDPGTYTLSSRMEQQDGTFFDEKTATIEVKGAATPATTQETSPAGGPSGIPGFTGALGATALGLSAFLASRRQM